MSFKLIQRWQTVFPSMVSPSLHLQPHCILASVLNQPRRFAGHSHWQNVKHTKDAKDKEKARNIQNYIRLVNYAIKAGGGNRDPKINSQLANVFADAKANSIPLATLERIIKAETTTDPYFIEVKAPGGLFILVETCAKAVTKERQDLACLVKKYGCKVPSTSSKLADFFNHTAWVCVPKASSPPSLDSLDAAINLGIEIGANEVEEGVVNGQSVYRFYCEPSSLYDMQQLLENEHSIQPVSVEETYVPISRVKVTSEAYKNLLEMYDRIKDQFEFVGRIVDNVTSDGS